MKSIQVSTPFAISLGLSLASTSFFVFANLGLTFVGPAVITSSKKVREKLGIDEKAAVKTFSWFYETSAPYFITASTLGTASLLASAYFLPQASELRQLGNNVNIKNLLYIAAGLQITPFPWTVIVMFPGIHKILDTRNALVKSPDASVNSEKVQESLDLIDTWKIHSAVRISFSAVAWSLATAVAILA